MLTPGDIRITFSSAKVRMNQDADTGPMRTLPDSSFSDVIRFVRKLMVGGIHEKLIRMQLVLTYGPENGYLLYQSARLYIRWFR